MTRWRRVPLVVLAVMAAQLLFGLAYAATNPVWAAPDEEQQLSTVISVAERGSYPRPGDARWEPSVINSRQYVPDIRSVPRGTRPGAPELTADPLPSFDELAGRTVEGERPRNQMTQHAPAFAGVLALPWLALRMGQWPLDVAVFGVRMLNCLMMLAITPLIWAGARRLGASRAAASLGALVPLAVPEFTWWSATINNDHLVTVAMGVLTYAGIRIATGDHRWRTYVLAGVALGVGLLTKAFALTGIVFVLIVALAGWWRGRGRQRGAPAHRASAGAVLVRTVGALTVAFVIGGWWYVVNVLRYGTFQPDGLLRETPPVTGAPPGAAAYVEQASRGFATSFFWSPGRLENPMPETWAWIGVGLLVALVLVGALRTRRVILSVGLLSLLVLTTGLVVAGSYANYTTTGRIFGIQGRYMFVGIVGVAVLVGCALPAGGRGVAGVVGRVAPPLAVLGVLAVQALALDDLVTIYHGGDVYAAGAASPVSPWLVLAAVAVAALALVVAYGVAAFGRADPGSGVDPAVDPFAVSPGPQPSPPPDPSPAASAGSRRSRT